MQLSVVIPTHNRPAELKRALASVNTQLSNISSDCLVVDDSDPEYKNQTRSIVRDNGAQYIESDRQFGGGGCGARNTGIYAARGKFIAFLDDDDEWDPYKLKKQLGQIEANGLQMVYTGLSIINKSGKIRYSFRAPRSENLHKEIMRENFIGTTSSIMVNRSLLVEVGGFDPSLPALQDYDLYIRLLRDIRLGWLPEPLTRYHAHDTGTKVSGDRNKFIAAVKCLSVKYKHDPFYPLLKNSFVKITLLKCIRSRRFLIDSIRALNRSVPV